MTTFPILALWVACAISACRASPTAARLSREDALLDALMGVLKKRSHEPSKVSTSDQEVILKVHNDFRRNVANYNGQPKAANMQKMYWSDTIASTAQTWANECEIGHDKNWARTKSTGLGVPIGQNMAWNYRDWKTVIKAWQSEVDDYKYDRGSVNGKAVGHYTQVVWSTSALVGCGYKKCSVGPIYFCNYAFGNSEVNPYTRSTKRCSACTKTCVEGLCDCEGKICANGGTLDLNTCQCSCANGFKGKTCGGCPPVDLDKSCGSFFSKARCSQWYNVPQACPIMCGVCKETCPGMTLASCKHGGTINSDCTCACPPEYKGKYCQTLKSCKPDPDYCGKSQPYGYPVDFCKKFTNVPTECPQMCGLC